MNVERKKKFLRWSAHTSLGPTKCKVMIFNTRREYDGKPRLSVERDDYLDVVKVVKLLGIIVRSDLKWCEERRCPLMDAKKAKKN